MTRRLSHLWNPRCDKIIIAKGTNPGKRILRDYGVLDGAGGGI